MAEPIWRKIVSELPVPEPQKQWQIALQVLTVGKLMMVEVVIDTARNPPEDGTWTPHGFVAACSADGDFTGTARGTTPPSGAPLVSSAPPGALIARIGGSTADQIADASPTPSRLVFSIGRRCVFTVPSSPVGSLFLGVNDDPARMADVTGRLLVNIYEAV
jgi:hypothetical protein